MDKGYLEACGIWVGGDCSEVRAENLQEAGGAGRGRRPDYIPARGKSLLKGT